MSLFDQFPMRWCKTAKRKVVLARFQKETDNGTPLLLRCLASDPDKEVNFPKKLLWNKINIACLIRNIQFIFQECFLFSLKTFLGHYWLYWIFPPLSAVIRGQWRSVCRERPAVCSHWDTRWRLLIKSERKIHWSPYKITRKQKLLTQNSKLPTNIKSCMRLM